MQPFYLYSDMPKLDYHKVWAEINTEALVYNYKLLCSLTKRVRHICAVKADAYGHNAQICVKNLLLAGCDFFAVSCIEEAISVRNICLGAGRNADILILGYTAPEQAHILAKYNIIQTILSESYAFELNYEAKTKNCSVRTHIAIDTGMNRIGLCAQSAEGCAEAAEAVKRIKKLPNVSVEGMFTHFARADEEYESTVINDSHVKTQFARFNSVRKALEADGINIFCHACNSAAAVRFPEYALDGVRFGILLYGIPPSEHIDLGVKPVMSLHTIISHIHKLLPGESLGYGGNFSSDEERTVATIPIGYADGFLRAYTNFCVTVQTDLGNFKAPVIGRVCMDQCMIDVTGLPLSENDRVTIFGSDPHDLFALAKMANTIEYEVLCLISARVPRIERS